MGFLVVQLLGLLLASATAASAAPRNVTVSDNDKYVVSNSNDTGDVELGNRVSESRGEERSRLKKTVRYFKDVF